MTRQEVVERGAGAAIGDQIGLGADLAGEQHAAQMPERADAGMRHLGVLSGLLHPVHQLRESARRQCGARHKDGRGVIDEPDRDEILFGIDAEIAVKRHACRQSNLVQQERIAVGRGARCVARGNHPPGSADVLDHDLLAERLRHAVLNDARDRIGYAAGRERHHEGNGTAGIDLRRCKAGRRNACDKKRRCERACECHGICPRRTRARPAVGLRAQIPTKAPATRKRVPADA